jgi:NAD+ kinase
MSARAKSRLKVGLVIKRSQWRIQVEEKRDRRLLKLIEARDPTVAALRASHDEHERTVAEVKEALRTVGGEVVSTRQAGEPFDSAALDLVVTVGGDGTLLSASHSVLEVPILGVNSSPSHSVGFFCGARSGSVLRAIEATVRGTVRRTRLTRMKVSVNGREAAARVLNDALFCHASPAATSRYIVELGPVVEQQKSSGFWIGPAAGSTAAQRSAGGRVLPLTSRNLQLVVREPYTPQGGDYELRHAFVRPDQVLIVRSKIHEAKIFFDGPDNVLDLGYGDVVEFTQARDDLTILGLTSRRKWGASG